MIRTTTGRRPQLRRLLLPAVIFGAAAGLLPSPAMADSDSVAITSPANGDHVVLYGGTSTLPADEPLTVTFTAAGSPTTCALDDEAATPCTSPFTFAHVTAGAHSLTVTAGTAMEVISFDATFVILCPPPEAPMAFGTVLTAHWKVAGTHTSARRIVLSHLGRHAHVKLSCLGTGCPTPGVAARVANGTVDLAAFLRGRALRPHTRVVIRVTKPNLGTATWTYTVRRGARPLVDLADRAL